MCFFSLDMGLKSQVFNANTSNCINTVTQKSKNKNIKKEKIKQPKRNRLDKQITFGYFDILENTFAIRYNTLISVKENKSAILKMFCASFFRQTRSLNVVNLILFSFVQFSSVIILQRRSCSKVQFLSEQSSLSVIY